MSDSTLPRSTVVAALVLLTLTLRLALLAIDSDRLQTDPDAYVRLAEMLAEGKGYVAADGLTPTAFRPVLYPLILSGGLRVGLTAAHTAAILNLVAGAVLGISAIYLAHLLNLPRFASVLAGFMVAVDPLLIRYTTEPMTENVCAALFAVALVLLLKFYQSATTPGTVPRFRVGIAAGTFLGLCALCRPIALVCCVLLTAVMILITIRHRQSFIRNASLMLIPAVVAAVTVSPWVIRNAIRFHALVPATTHGGYTLLLGNNRVFYDEVVSGRDAAWSGESLARWQQGLHNQMVDDQVNLGSERAVDQWMYAKAQSEIRDQPQMLWSGFVLRWKRFWAITPTVRPDSIPRMLVLLVGGWYAVSGIGLLLSLLLIRHNTSVLLLWISVGSFLMVHSFYWTNTRMRAPLTGVLVVLSVTGWLHVLSSRVPGQPARTSD